MVAGLVVFPGAHPCRDRDGRTTTGALYFYEDETYTPQPVYTASDLLTAHPHPVETDDTGAFPEMWADTATLYTASLHIADGQVITIDHFGASNSADTLILTGAQAAADDAQQIADDLGDLDTALTTATTAATTATTQATAASASATSAAASAVTAEFWADQAEAIVGGDDQPANDLLTAISGLGSNGLIARTSSSAAAARTITAPAAGITVTNGDGVAGNPTLALANDLAGVEGLSATGLVRRTGDGTWTAGTTVATAEIADDAVTMDKLLGATATSRVLGRITSGAGNFEELTAANLHTILATFGKQSIWVPAGAMIARTTNGAATGTVETTTNKVMFKTLDFDTTTQEFAQFSIAMPKSWDEGTVTFAPIWSHASTTTNFGVVWQLAGVAISDDDAGDAAFGTAQTSTDTGGTTNDIYRGPESSAITIAGSPAAEDYVVFQVARVPANGSDTMAVDARLHGVVLFITNNASSDA